MLIKFQKIKQGVLGFWGFGVLGTREVLSVPVRYSKGKQSSSALRPAPPLPDETHLEVAAAAPLEPPGRNTSRSGRFERSLTSPRAPGRRVPPTCGRRILPRVK